MEYVKHSCNEEKKSLCEFCATHNWISPPAKRIPQPKPDEDNPGHYLPVFKTPLVDNEGKIREVDDWQPRVHITSLFKEGKISLNDKDAIKETASRLGIDEKLVVSCSEHLRDLSVNKQRRTFENRRNKNEKINAKYEDYDLLSLVRSGKINKLLVMELDKYLQKHKLNTNCKKTDKIRAITADVLQKETIEKQQKVINHILNSPIDKDSDHPVDKDLDNGDNDETEDSDSDDLVFKDLDFEVENEENEDEDLNSEEEDLIVTTRYGRTATSL